MSPLIQPDTSQMTDFEPSVPGTYLATIVQVDAVRSKGDAAAGKAPINGIQPVFEFEAPRLADNEVRTITRRAWLPIEGKGTFGFDQLLRCTGNEELADEIKERPGQVAFDTDKLMNQKVNVIIVTGLYTPKGAQQARQQDEIQSFLAV